MHEDTKCNELTGTQLGQMQNHLGLIIENEKGKRFLDSQKFLEYTQFTPTAAAKDTGLSRQQFYHKKIPLKPSTRLTERVIMLITATDIAYELFEGRTEETAKWMVSPNALLFGSSPFEVCMRGDAKPLIQWLLDRAGVRQVG